MLGAMRIPLPNRRWFQFSLRTLLVFVTLSAIPCSWLAVKLRDVKHEEAAAAAIVEAGGRVEWGKDAPGPAWLGGVLGEHFFGHVISVTLEGEQVTEGALENLDAMNYLQDLLLLGPKVTDSGLEHLQGLRELKWLDIDSTNVTNAGLEKIARLKQLEFLNLRGTQVTDAGLGKLAGLNKLQSLGLTNTNVTDAGLEHLQRMKQLTEVDLNDTHVTAAGVVKLRQALPKCGVDWGP
jgi:hypothetical protein